MYNQTTHLTHELKFCIQITWRGVVLTEIPPWMILAGAKIQTMTFQPRLCALQPHLPYRNWPFSWLHTVGPHSSGQYSGGPLWSGRQQAIWNTVQTCPEPVRLERVLLSTNFGRDENRTLYSWLRSTNAASVLSSNSSLLFLLANSQRNHSQQFNSSLHCSTVNETYNVIDSTLCMKSVDQYWSKVCGDIWKL